MEVISSFELGQTTVNLGHQEMISFKMFGKEYLMSYTNFSLRMGLVDVEYTRTES